MGMCLPWRKLKPSEIPATTIRKEDIIVVKDNTSQATIIPLPETHKTGIKVLIDPGHGKDTLGKRSPYSACGIEPALEFYEWAWNREIAQKIYSELTARGVDAEILVSETTDIPLKTRTERVNSWCTKLGTENVILISIHSNACGDGSEWVPSACGWSAYTTIGETESDRVAEYLYDAAEKEWNGTSLKIRKDTSDGDRDWEENFYILCRSMCPAVLSENFFYTSPDDTKYILSEEGKEAVTRVHVEALIRYINNRQNG